MDLNLIKEKLNYWKDPKFVFNEEEHIYTYEKEKFISVTTFVHDFLPKFDENYHAKRIADREGVHYEEILQKWKETARIACDLGTETHVWIENFYNDNVLPDPENERVLERVNKFKKIHTDWLKKFKPVSQELRLFSKKWKIAGTTDALFYYPENKGLYVGDWKTNKEYKHDNHPKGTYNKMLPPFEKNWVNEHNTYSVQVSLYRLILEENEIETKGAFLCHLGPNDPGKIWQAKDMREPLREYLDKIWVKKIKQK